MMQRHLVQIEHQRLRQDIICKVQLAIEAKQDDEVKMTT